jgi:hypothetical protein
MHKKANFFVMLKNCFAIFDILKNRKAIFGKPEIPSEFPSSPEML